MRIGAVNYLNSKPLIEGFDRLAGGLGESWSLRCDLPSRLADSLAAGRLDVALVPTFAYLRDPTNRLVSDACVAADGPVASVKVYFFTDPERVRTLALDEGSRTSAALSRVLLARRHGVRPERLPLPIGRGLADVRADAVLLIGDRAMHPPAPGVARRVVAEWDLGHEWRHDTGLPFVFACWAAGPAVGPGAEPSLTRCAELLGECRDWGVTRFASIARREAPGLGLSVEHAERYLRENIRFSLGPRERRAMAEFADACREAGLLPAAAPLAGA